MLFHFECSPSRSASQSVSQSVGQSVNQSNSQSISPSVHQSISPSVHQSISPSVHQSISPSVHQSISPSVHQSIDYQLVNYPHCIHAISLTWEAKLWEDTRDCQGKRRVKCRVKHGPPPGEVGGATLYRDFTEFR